MLVIFWRRKVFQIPSHSSRQYLEQWQCKHKSNQKNFLNVFLKQFKVSCFDPRAFVASDALLAFYLFILLFFSKRNSLNLLDYPALTLAVPCQSQICWNQQGIWVLSLD